MSSVSSRRWTIVFLTHELHLLFVVETNNPESVFSRTGDPEKNVYIY